MALPELYEQITWHNGTTPAINEDNLNAMSQALKDIDDRLIGLAGTIMEDVPIIKEALEALDPPIRVVKDFAGVQALTDALDKNAVDVKVKVTPKQDLHGFSKPWVDGAGKNKLPLKVSNLKNMNSSGTWSGSVYTKGGLTFSAETNDGENVNAITINGSASERVVLYLNSRFSPSSGQYTLSKTANTSSISMVASAYNNTTWVKALAQFSSGAPTFTIDYDGYDRIEIYIVIQSGTTISNVKFYPQLELGSTATAFEPYTNICPITGFTEAKVTRTGKNLFDGTLTNGQINNGGAYSSNNTRVSNADATISNRLKIKAGKYTIGAENLDYCTLLVKDASGDILYNDANAWHSLPYTFTNPSEGYLYFTCRKSDNSNISTTQNIQVQEGSTAVFDGYTATTYTISLGDTRYLAELDVITGVLTVTGGYIASYAGETLPGAWISDRDAYTEGGTPTTGAQVVYELATPVTVQLTATEVALLYAYNVLWADTGDLALTYDASGVLRIANSKLDIDTFKSIVASSSDFADFKSKVAAL